MSEPVQLPYSGLSLSLPAGFGWEGDAVWSYATGNEFNLSAELRAGSQLGTVAVHCRYLLAPPETDPQQVLIDRLDAATLQEARSGRIVNDVTIHWVQIADTFLGVAELDHGRMLEIRATAQADRRLADKIFRLVAESVVFESDELISQGANFIRRFRSRGLGDIIQQQNADDGENIYLINDARNQPVGFQIETFSKNAEHSDWSNVAVERIHSTGRSRFECTDRMDRFLWQTWRKNRRTSRAITTIELAGDGEMRISDATSSGELTYRPGEHAVPEILIDRLTRAFLDAYEKEALVDLVLANGTIIPVVISTVDASPDTDNKWGAAYSVRVRPLLGRDAYVTSYFDFEKNLVGKIEKNQRVLLYWHKSDRKTLTETFENVERYLGPPPVGQ